ncbi:MAG: hypothetical protein PSX37_02165 [bacterium]|nr:hypothetical protein [bacterium]
MRRLFTVGAATYALAFSAGAAAAQPVASSRTLDVTWPEDYDGAAAPFPDKRLNRVGEILLPVMLPEGFLRFKTFELVPDELYYSASVAPTGAKISIAGTRIAIDAGPAASDAGEGVSSELSEASVNVGQTRYGVAYLLTVECRARKDSRCRDDAYARSLFASLEFIGGSKQTPKPRETGAASPLPPTAPFDANFAYRPPGELTPGSGAGVKTETIYAPGLRFPVEKGPAYLNSQVWGLGGGNGPQGSWRDAANY